MGAMAVDRTFWLSLRADYRTCEDVEWWLRTAQQANVETVHELGLLVRRHDGVRNLSGVDVRLRDDIRLIEENREWFDAHPKAEAFRLRRNAHYASLMGRRVDSVRALFRSLRRHPTLRTTKQLLLAAGGTPRQRSDT